MLAKKELVSVRPNDNNFVKCLKNKSLAFLTPDNKFQLHFIALKIKEQLGVRAYIYTKYYGQNVR